MRGPVPAGGPSLTVLSAATEAHRFAIAVTQLVFEVIERRRGSSQLGEAVAPAVVDQITALVRHDAFHIASAIAAPSTSTAPATGIAVQRVHVQLCDPCVAELFGSFSNDGQVRPFAGRVERKPCRVRTAPGAGGLPGRRPALGRLEYRWQLVALEFC